jgi:hypothetical protein
MSWHARVFLLGAWAFTSIVIALRVYARPVDVLLLQRYPLLLFLVLPRRQWNVDAEDQRQVETVVRRVRGFLLYFVVSAALVFPIVIGLVP